MGFIFKYILRHLISIQTLLYVLYARDIKKTDFHFSYTHFPFLPSAEENTQEPREGKSLVHFHYLEFF